MLSLLFLVLALFFASGPAFGQTSIELTDYDGQPLTQARQFSYLFFRVTDSASAGLGSLPVEVSSDIRGDHLTGPLQESPAGSGVFVGSVFLYPKLMSDTSSGFGLTITEDPGPPHRYDTVRITLTCQTAPCPQASIPTYASSLGFLDDQGNPLSRIPIGDAFIVELRDNTGANMAVTLTAQPGGDTETVFPQYAGGYPGDIYSRATITTATGPAVPGDGVLQIDEGGTLVASHLNYLGSTTTISAPTGSMVLELLDHTGNPTTALFEQSYVRMRATDPADNLSPAVAETLSVVAVTKDVNGDVRDQETFDLTETGPDTGVFTGQILFWPTPSPALENHTLEDWISANNEQDTVTVSLGAASVTGTVLPGRVWFVDANGNPASQFGWGSRLHIRGEGDAYNYPGLVNIMPVTVRGLTSGSSVLIYLYETGVDTGLFEGTVDTGATAGYPHLTVQPGEQVEAEVIYNAVVPFSAQATIGSNQAPTPQDDAVTESEGNQIVLYPLFNDSDPEGDPLTLTGISVPPSHGTVDLLNGGGVLYTPVPYYNGTDSLRYTVSDSFGNTAEATIQFTLIPVNNPPAVPTGLVFNVTEDTPLTFTLPVSDPDGDTPVLVWLVPPADGTLVSNSDGSLTYTPALNANGDRTFTYRYQDLDGATADGTSTLHILPVQDPPVAVDDTLVMQEDHWALIQILQNDYDPDGDPLEIRSFTQPAHGTLDGSSIYTPNPNYYGTDSYTYTISDPSGATATATVRITLTPVDDLPVARDDSFTISEDFGERLDPLANDSDAEGPVFLVMDNIEHHSAHGTYFFYPDGFGKIDYSPNPDFNGTDTFTYSIFDGTHQATATVTVIVTPVNDPPIGLPDRFTTLEDTPLTFAVLTNDRDVDGDALSVSRVTQPAHGTAVINADGTITYAPAANYNGADFFNYYAADGAGAESVPTRVDLTVTAVQDPPVARDDVITVQEDTPTNLNVTLNDSDPDNDFVGVQSVTQPAHGTLTLSGSLVYTSALNYNGPDAFTYTASDGHGNTATASVSLTVTPVNDRPVAVQDNPTTLEDTPVTIAVLANDSDVEGDALTITGFTQGLHGVATLNADGTVTYIPALNYNGTDTFLYNLSDGHGGAASGLVRVTLTPVNDPPVANANSATTNEDTAVAINVTANDSDVDGDSLSVESVTPPAYGTATFTGGTITYTPAADFNGIDSFTYTVSDGHGGTATAAVSVTVSPVNDPPRAVDDNVTTPEDTTIQINVLSNDIDDGSGTQVLTVGIPAHGTAFKNVSTGNIVYTPSGNYYGPDSFTYTIQDLGNLTATATVYVTVTSVNDLPVAISDSASTAEDTPVTVNVLANDSDPEGDALSVAGATQGLHGSTQVNADNTITYTPALNYYNSDSFTYTLRDANGGTRTGTVNVTISPVNDPPVAVDDTAITAEDTAKTVSVRTNDSDPELDSLTVTGVTQPAHGTATFTTVSVTYTPAANYNGADAFTYTISDGKGGTASATVSITVTPVNDAPTAGSDTATTTEDTAAAVNVLANDTDPDGDSLAVTAVTQPAHGSATFTASGVTYTPAANYNGADSFTYTISDGNGGTATGTVSVTITAVNDPPSAGADSATTAEDTAKSISVLTNDSDSDGDTLTVTAVTQPAHGSATFTASGVTYTPAANYNGTDSFTYTVSDGNGGSATGTVNITVTSVNDAPSASADSATTAEDTAKSISVLTNDSDPDGDTLSVTAVTQPAHGSVTFTASGVTYTPAANYNGADSFTYTISDGNGGTSTGTVSISITAVNDPPVAISDAGTTREGVAVTVSVLANDSDIEGSALTVTGVSTPTHGSASFSPSSVTYTPAANFNGVDTFTYTVSDGAATNTATVTITVKDALERVAILATNSAWIQTGADVLSGDVVVNQAGAGPFLNGAELSLAGTVTTPAGWDLDADSLTIAAGTTVASDIFFNQLTNSGTITGQQTSTLTLPVFASLPAFLTATPSTTDVSVGANGNRTLAPGNYRDLIVGKKGTVIFSGGTYHFRSITTDTQAKLLFSAASTVRVQQKVSIKATNTVGPNTGATINASSIVFYVAGINGTGGGLAETPKAVEIGADNTLTANLYAPNGTLWIADRTQARGSLIGKDVQIGPDVQVTLQTAWSGQ